MLVTEPLWEPYKNKVTDYGTFTPIQVAAIAALEDQNCVEEIVKHNTKESSMRWLEFYWLDCFSTSGNYVCLGPIPEQFKSMGSPNFSNCFWKQK